MKKIIAIVSGSFVIAAGLVVPLSNASQISYHNYLFNQQLKKENQTFSQRKVRPAKNQIKNLSKLAAKKSSIRNHRYPSSGKRYFYDDDKSVAKGIRREVSDRTIYFNKAQNIVPNNQRKKSWAFSSEKPSREIDIRGKISIAGELNTYKNDEYTVQLPKGLDLYEDDSFYDEYKNLAISIKHIKGCEGRGFSACAINTSKNENYVTARDKISNISRIRRKLRVKDSVHNDISVKAPTFNETFEGVYLGQEVFISRYFVADGIGGFYLIDAKTNKKNSARDLDAMKKVFDSFRIT